MNESNGRLDVLLAAINANSGDPFKGTKPTRHYFNAAVRLVKSQANHPGTALAEIEATEIRRLVLDVLRGVNEPEQRVLRVVREKRPTYENSWSILQGLSFAQAKFSPEELAGLKELSQQERREVEGEWRDALKERNRVFDDIVKLIVIHADPTAYIPPMIPEQWKIGMIASATPASGRGGPETALDRYIADVLGAARKITGRGVKVTQTSVADELGVTGQTIGRRHKKFCGGEQFPPLKVLATLEAEALTAQR